eukprot:1160547-Pelagomonas_calceolata.AAC.6
MQEQCRQPTRAPYFSIDRFQGKWGGLPLLKHAAWPVVHARLQEVIGPHARKYGSCRPYSLTTHAGSTFGACQAARGPIPLRYMQAWPLVHARLREVMGTSIMAPRITPRLVNWASRKIGIRQLKSSTIGNYSATKSSTIGGYGVSIRQLKHYG